MFTSGMVMVMPMTMVMIYILWWSVSTFLLIFFCKKDTKQAFSPSCRIWPICVWHEKNCYGVSQQLRGANTEEEFEEIQMERSEKYKSGDVGNTNAAARGWQWLAGQKLIAAQCPPLPLTDFATKIPKSMSVCLWNWKTAGLKWESRSKKETQKAHHCCNILP